MGLGSTPVECALRVYDHVIQSAEVAAADVFARVMHEFARVMNEAA